MNLPRPSTTSELYLAAILAELLKLNNGSVEQKQSASEGEEVDLVELRPKRKRRKSRIKQVTS